MQQINLFHAQFKPKQVILPARQMLLLTLLIIITLAVMSVYAFQQNATMKQTTASLQQLTIQQSINQDIANPLLNAELVKIQQQQQEKELLLDYLTNQTFGNQRGFSDTLSTLSQQGVNKVWLTEFSLLSGGQVMTLQGQATQASQVPVYIDSLAKSPQFKGKKFSGFHLQHPATDAELYSFQLNTSAGNP